MFLGEAPDTVERQALFRDDLETYGYVMNLTRAWAWLPEGLEHVFAGMDAAAGAGGLSVRDKGVLVTATAQSLGDGYCALAWGSRLAATSDPATAVEMAAGGDPPALTVRETVLAGWARLLVTDPNSTTEDDVQRLRAVGLTDQEIFAVTVYVALRIAFSTVNDAIGAVPDAELVAKAPNGLVDAIEFGRLPAKA